MNVFVKSILLTATVFGSVTASADDKKNLTNIPVSTVLDQSMQFTEDKLTLELFNYEEYIYSRSLKTEIGDQVGINTRFRYQITDSAWTSMGFRTRPDIDRADNKTSDFEIRAGYNFQDLVAQIDLSLNTNDQDGSISVGMDLDSENTFLRYNFANNLQLTFFPFNFDGEVGVEFETYDVTRIYYIQGTPALINLNPDPTDPDERLANKTLPGFVLQYNKIEDEKNVLSAYVGFGLATYEFPNTPGFDIRETASGTAWSRRETYGYKFGGLLRNKNSFTSLQYVGQTEDQETGVLLKSAASVYDLRYFGNLILESEVTASEGGRRPYRVDFKSNWFDTVDDKFTPTIAQRIYSNRSGLEIQDWAGKWGYAGSLKLGIRKQGYSPYFSYKYQSKHFVFSGRESAHELRTNTLDDSHGGLHRIGLGAYFYKNKFIINPRFEYMIAKNNVFINDDNLTNAQVARDLTDSDFVFYLNVSYFYDKKTGPRTFRL